VAYAKYRLDYQTLINSSSQEATLTWISKKRIRVMIRLPAGYEPIK
jgi:hypothetical protein